MGKKRKDDVITEDRGFDDAGEITKRAKKGSDHFEPVSKKQNKVNNDKKIKNFLQASKLKKDANKSPRKKIYEDTSSSSNSESEINSVKTDRLGVSDSKSDSDSGSSDSESSATSRDEEEEEEVVPKPPEKTENIISPKNSTGNLLPSKSYALSSKSSSSGSYHSDTEEEDKKRRKKQKKLLQMQLNKKAKRNNFPRTEVKQEVQSDEEGPDNMPCSNGNNEVPRWPESDYAELIKRIEAQIPPKDNQKFDSRAAKLNWSEIAFGDYSAEDCMEVWLAISRRIRRYRILAEILQDAREWVRKPWTNFYRGSKKNRHPDMPAKPLSTYMIYYLEQKDKVAKKNPNLDMTQVSKIISEMYKNLTPEERGKYTELAATQRRNFDVKLSEFYKEHPEIAQQLQQKKTETKDLRTKGPRKASNPFKLFFQDQLKKRGDSDVDKKVLEEKAKEKWKNLSDKKKIFWINRALDDHKRFEDEMRAYKLEHPEYVPPNSSKSVLNKDERLIKERLAGKPVKPPNSAYSLFSRIMLQSDPDVKSIPPKERMAEISRKWKGISQAQKLHYEEEVKAMQETYKLEFASYLEGLSPEERVIELKKNQSKRKASVAEEKVKKKAARNKSNYKAKNDDDEILALYKGEPKPPPVDPFGVFLQSFRSENDFPDEMTKIKQAKKSWEALPDSKREQYRQQLEKLKLKYIKDFEIFLKNLSPEQLKEFSVLKEKARKSSQKDDSESINGKAGCSHEVSDDEDCSSSDSDSDDSDSGKSSKSSSSSEESEI